MNRHLVILTGLSGSGKSTGARALEDSGFFVVDNLPLVMLPDFLSLTGRAHQKVAVVVDARSSEFLIDCRDMLNTIEGDGYQVEVVFFEASDQDIYRRFSETRRRHPLVQAEGLVDAVSQERHLMSDLRQQSTVIIDSTGLTVHQLRQKVLTVIFGPDQDATMLQIQLQSFGFRYGLPLEADLVFDVRFLDNPHFVPELKPLTGLDPGVSGYVLSQVDYQEFVGKLMNLLFFLVPRYQSEGKTGLTLCIGCTGGRHRSVAIAEDLSAYLMGTGCGVTVSHRDIEKG
jgi:UPF0042 nucleotide-binding protein